MKKQILILILFVAAIVAGTTNAFAQNVTQVEPDYLEQAATFCTPAVALDCGTGDQLTPMPGVVYTYEISSSSVGTVHWFVTDDPDILLTGSLTGNNIDPGDGNGNYLLTADVGVTYNNTANGSVTIDLSWKSFDGAANEVLLVAYAEDAATCTNNIEVYRIIPQYAFTLDIAGILDDGTSGAAECVSPIVSAQYDGTNLNVDYGTNYVYFSVNAANWQTSWETDLAATTDGGSAISSIEWQYPDLATTGGAWNASGTEVLASHYASGADGFIDDVGECIIVRVQVDHLVATENIADETITLTVNGEMINAQTASYDGTYPDLDEGGAGNACLNNVDDTADYVITPRPDVNEVDPTPFENKVPRD